MTWWGTSSPGWSRERRCAHSFSNIDALDAVLTEISSDPYDRVLVLGDLVGYGASPNEVVDRVYELSPDIVIRGNHDKVAAGIEGPEHFNPVAAEAARWTYETLSDSNRTRVAELPVGPVQVTEEIEICHGTPYDEDVYVFDQDDALRALASASGRLCFFGHTHVTVVFSMTSPAAELEVLAPEIGAPLPTVISLDPARRYLINPGSVGQPRDGDPRAAYGIYDSDKNHVELRRVAYRVDLAQEKITAAGLPDALARRLGVGR